MKPLRFVAVTTIDNTGPLYEALFFIQKNYGNIIELEKIYMEETSPKEIKSSLEKADIILVDIRGDTPFARELPGMLTDLDKTVVTLVGGSSKILSLTKMGEFDARKLFSKEAKMDVKKFRKTYKMSKFLMKIPDFLKKGFLKDFSNWIKAQRYYSEGDPQNLANLLLFLAKNYGGINVKYAPPKEKPLYYVYKRIKNKLAPKVGILVYSGMHLPDTAPFAEALAEKLKEFDVKIVASNAAWNLEAIKKYFKKLDIVVNLQYFRLNGGPYGGDPSPTFKILKKLDCPLLIGLRSYATELPEWEKSANPLNPLEIILGITLPEMDGAIEPFFLGGLKTVDVSKKGFIGKIKKVYPVEERVEKFARRIKRWLALRKKPNCDKKIAIVIYEYPPGLENLGSAGYLDVFESLSVFLKKLKKRGYRVPSYSADEIRETMLELSEKEIKEYKSWYSEIPQQARQELEKTWGPPQKTWARFFEKDNLFIGIQPSRGVHENPEKVYHDRELPPPHDYLAFYLYIQKKFGADAIVHFGMHGTCEFMKGKEVALSKNCFPDILIGELPSLYYYWIGNPSESTIAKRRIYALCISHASPPMRKSGLYGDYLLLEELLNQWKEDKNNEALEAFRNLAKKLHFPEEPEEAEREIYRMKKSLIPEGLHVMGKTLTGKELDDYAAQVEEFSSGAFEKEFVKKLASKNFEIENMLKALEGRYIEAAVAGDPVKDPTVYPAGRAMYAFDPRRIPTLAAVKRGSLYAKKLLENYYEKTGKYPESVGIVLWGFETMKTGGDTIAAIFELLGVRIKQGKNPWFKEFEIIPLEELGRPRVDVIITICGIFRDTFGTHIDLINRITEKIASLDEPEEKNFVKKHKNQTGTTCRVFGPSPVEYATSVRTLVESGIWKNETELVEAYLESMKYLYTNQGVVQDRKVLEQFLSKIDMVTQERDCSEYDLVDLDHYYEFLGGLARSVKELKRKAPEIMVADATTEEIWVEDVNKTIERGVRTRLLNPAWIEGMLKHKFHGAQKIAQRFENILGLAATTGAVSNWIFDELAEKYIFDERMREKIVQNNPYAASKISNVLLQAAKRGYWKTEKLEKLKKLILQLESEIE